MMKLLVVAAVAALIAAPDAAAQSIVQKSDWQSKPFEAYLPPPTPSVPWLDLDVRTRLPKRDLPTGWQAQALPPFHLHLVSTDAQVSSNAAGDVRRM